MDTQDKLLFATDEPLELGLGFHNVGTGVLRYAKEEVQKKVEKHYGQRCGHIPMNAKTVGVLIDSPDLEMRSQIAYLSELYGRDIKILTPKDLKKYKSQPFVVPYIQVPETEKYIGEINAVSWGLPGSMTHALKNKSEFCRIVDDLDIKEFRLPEYKITYLQDVAAVSKKFLIQIEEMYDKAGLKNYYPLGVMLRASDEDGNYGCSLAYERGGFIIVVPNGDMENAKLYGNWDEALASSERILDAAMDQEKEPRVVISRYIDTIDSPGMSAVILDGKIHSLGWNGQLQAIGSKACIGTSSYKPVNTYLRKVQKAFEDQTSELFETFLRKVALMCKVDLNKIAGVTNIDMMLPSEKEKELQRNRGQKVDFYFAECNPRWTNYTDAILTIIGVNRQKQTIRNMKKVIKDGIYTIDKYPLPRAVDPRLVRQFIFEKDKLLKKDGTRIICRMAKRPMGVILAGDIMRGEQEMENIVQSLPANNWGTQPNFLLQEESLYIAD